MGEIYVRTGTSEALWPAVLVEYGKLRGHPISLEEAEEKWNGYDERHKAGLKATPIFKKLHAKVKAEYDLAKLADADDLEFNPLA